MWGQLGVIWLLSLAWQITEEALSALDKISPDRFPTTIVDDLRFRRLTGFSSLKAISRL
jgi:hypothetical protein